MRQLTMRLQRLAFRHLIAGLLAAAAVALAHAQNGSQQTATAPERGRQIYVSVGCYLCHGHFGQGGAGRKLAPAPLPYPAFAQYVRHPTGDMPPYTTRILSDADLGDIHAFLTAIPSGKPAQDIPLLNSIAFPPGGGTAGRQSRQAIFLQNCAACHQAAGGGVPGTAPPLAGSTLVNGDAMRLAKLVLDGGFRNPAMPRFEAILKPDQAAAVLSYIRTSWGNRSGAVTSDDIRARTGR
jgi:ubiquinol-cytochrome c reductase cytochrome c subunit